MPDIDLYINFDGVGKILRYRDSVFYAVLNGIEQALPLDSGLRVQYSVDTSSWHDSAATGDKYIRVSTDSGATWQAGIKFAGDNGANGITYTPYTAYASDDAGTGFSLTWNDTLKYFATVQQLNAFAYFLAVSILRIPLRSSTHTLTLVTPINCATCASVIFLDFRISFNLVIKKLSCFLI